MKQIDVKHIDRHLLILIVMNELNISKAEAKDLVNNSSDAKLQEIVDSFTTEVMVDHYE